MKPQSTMFMPKSGSMMRRRASSTSPSRDVTAAPPPAACTQARAPHRAAAGREARVNPRRACRAGQGSILPPGQQAARAARRCGRRQAALAAAAAAAEHPSPCAPRWRRGTPSCRGWVRCSRRQRRAGPGQVGWQWQRAKTEGPRRSGGRHWPLKLLREPAGPLLPRRWPCRDGVDRLEARPQLCPLPKMPQRSSVALQAPKRAIPTPPDMLCLTAAPSSDSPSSCLGAMRCRRHAQHAPTCRS